MDLCGDGEYLLLLDNVLEISLDEILFVVVVVAEILLRVGEDVDQVIVGLQPPLLVSDSCGEVRPGEGVLQEGGHPASGVEERGSGVFGAAGRGEWVVIIAIVAIVVFAIAVVVVVVVVVVFVDVVVDVAGRGGRGSGSLEAVMVMGIDFGR